MSEQNDQGTPGEKSDAFSAGKHCARADCRTLDFLPLVCPHCQLHYCGTHAHVSYHDCRLPTEALLGIRRGEGAAASNTSTGADPVRELVIQHTPQPITANEDRHAKAKHILATRFPAPAVRERQPTRPTKELSPALKLILLRRQAVSGDPNKKEKDVPLGCRWYGRLGLFITTPDWHRKHWIEKLGLVILRLNPSLFATNFSSSFSSMHKSELLSHSQSCSTSDLQLFTIRSEDQPHLITNHCSATWGDVVEDGEEVWLASRNMSLP
ncbi:uncharacterized protein VP01_3069g2 [Puccinia sorghi]|uniref:AN1-type domain-containing protein n=1 Tax=Puccinia sorghi TaxID=27349 RepID=A0A0L6UZQ7_9BASI|nr:uncharacterized protein VP01_3069g2 [Puccinia sorghi]